MNRIGVDISKWQGDFPIKQLNDEGFTFAILKAGGADNGYYEDKCFHDNYIKCRYNSMPVGAYYYGDAHSIDDAQKEAIKFCSILKGKRFNLPVFYDVEGAMLSNPKNLLTDIIKRFITVMDSQGYLCGVYMSADAYNNAIYNSELVDVPHWIASWTKKQPEIGEGRVDFWQFGGETNKLRDNKLFGQVVDMDYQLTDYEYYIYKNELNNYKMLDGYIEIALQVMEGKWGNGSERRERITAAGYNYNEVQKVVNSIISQGW